MAMRVEGNGSDAVTMSHRLIDVPVVVGGISRHMGGELVGGDDRALEERAIIGDIIGIKLNDEDGRKGTSLLYTTKRLARPVYSRGGACPRPRMLP